jgi:hypothetical protein
MDNFIMGPFAIAATIFALQYLTSEAQRAKGRRVNGDFLYPSVRGVEFIYSILLAVSAGLLFISIRGSQSDRAFGIPGSSFFILLALLAWPKAIWLSSSGLRQRAWYGGWKRLQWEDVSEVVENQDRSIIVRGKDTKITFSPFHAERESFIKEVHRHQFSHPKSRDFGTTSA